MKEKEEAKRIIDLYYELIDYNTVAMPNIKRQVARQFALIHVEGLIQEIRLTVQFCRIVDVETLGGRITFLEKVKQQIENY